MNITNHEFNTVPVAMAPKWGFTLPSRKARAAFLLLLFYRRALDLPSIFTKSPKGFVTRATQP